MTRRARRGPAGRVDGRLGVVVVGQVPPPIHGQALVNVALAAGRYERLDLELVPMRFSRDVADVGHARPGKVLELGRVVARALGAWRRGRRDVLVYGVGLRGRGAALRDAVVLGLLRPWFGATVLQVHTGECRAVLRSLPPGLRQLADRAYGGAELVLYPDPLLDADEQGLPRPRRVEYLVYGIDDPLGADARSDGAGAESSDGHGASASGDAGPLVLFMANLYPSKGTEVLVEAFGRVVAARRAAGAPLPRLALVGAPPDRDTLVTLRARAVEAGVAGLVELPGPEFGAAKAALFRSAAVFCFPTFYEAEAMPLVIFEAMAYGLPVLTTDWRAIPRVVTHGVDGVLVAPRDVDALTVELARLVDDPVRRAELGAAARATFSARFTVETFRARFETTLWDAVGRRDGTPASAATRLPAPSVNGISSTGRRPAVEEG